MLKFRTALICLLCAAALTAAGCGEPRLDTSSDTAFAESLQKIHESLPETRRPDFLYNLEICFSGREPVSFSRAQRSIPSLEELVDIYGLTKLTGDQEDLELIEALNGLSADEINARAAKLLATELEAKLAENAAELKELEAYLAELEAFEQDLAKVSLELGPVQAREGRESVHKGRLGGLGLRVKIKNGSSRQLLGFSDGAIKFTDHQGREMKIQADLNRAADSAGQQIFQSQVLSGQPDGLAPGAEFSGEVVEMFFQLPQGYPYPPEGQFSASFAGQPAPKLKGGEELSGFNREMWLNSLEKLRQHRAELEERLKALAP